ncbi:MAG: hypothetical protein ACR2PB_10465 [Desulfocapsaceae bacterium]
MDDQILRLSWAPDGTADCSCLLIIPERAVDEPGYIRAVHPSGTINKHEFHALAQTGYYQLQDDELDYCETEGLMAVVSGEEKESLKDGMILFRDTSGSIRAVLHPLANPKKLLETANRFCTRWVRLDI